MTASEVFLLVFPISGTQLLHPWEHIVLKQSEWTLGIWSHWRFLLSAPRSPIPTADQNTAQGAKTKSPFCHRNFKSAQETQPKAMVEKSFSAATWEKPTMRVSTVSGSSATVSSCHQDAVSKLMDFWWRPTSISFLWFQVSFCVPLLPLRLKTSKAELPHSHCYYSSLKLYPFSPSRTLCQKAKKCTGLTEFLHQIYFREFRSSNSSKLQVPRHTFPYTELTPSSKHPQLGEHFLAFTQKFLVGFITHWGTGG